MLQVKFSISVKSSRSIMGATFFPGSHDMEGLLSEEKDSLCGQHTMSCHGRFHEMGWETSWLTSSWGDIATGLLCFQVPFALLDTIKSEECIGAL